MPSFNQHFEFIHIFLLRLSYALIQEKSDIYVYIYLNAPIRVHNGVKMVGFGYTGLFWYIDAVHNTPMPSSVLLEMDQTVCPTTTTTTTISCVHVFFQKFPRFKRISVESSPNRGDSDLG